MPDLRLDRIGVGRKGRLFHQDLEPRFRRPIKRGHHQVQIHREAVHADHFHRLRADDPRHRLAQILVIRIPGRFGIEVRVDAERSPVIQFLFDDSSRLLRHQPERIAGEINKRIAVRPGRQMKFLAKGPERVVGIESHGEFFVSAESHWATLHGSRSPVNATVLDRGCVGRSGQRPAEHLTVSKNAICWKNAFR